MVRRVEDYTGVDETLAELMSRVNPLPGTETVPTVDSLGRLSAAEVRCVSDIPPFAVSHMDGYAVISRDLADASEDRPARLEIVGESKLGSRTSRPIGTGGAIQVATGSRIPDGADVVVQKERVKIEGTAILVSFPQKPGDHIYERGNDFMRGDRVLGRGRVIRAQDIGLLLGQGILKVKVRRRPRVAVLATGSELVEASHSKAGRIADSHSPVFLNLVKSLGCTPVRAGIAGDETTSVMKGLRKALGESDLVLTLGGTSVGGRDLVGGAVGRLGPVLFHHGIRMDRGRVTGVAVVKGKPIVIMPGPIQGAMNAFFLFGVPLINRLSGRGDVGVSIQGRLLESWEARKGFANFQKVVYVKMHRGARHGAEPIAGDTESKRVLHDADGYVVVPEDVTSIQVGSPVDIRLIPGFSWA